VVAGEALGAKAVIDTQTRSLPGLVARRGSRRTVPVPSIRMRSRTYFEGSARVGERELAEGQLAVLGSGDAVRLRGGKARLFSRGRAAARACGATTGPS